MDKTGFWKVPQDLGDGWVAEMIWTGDRAHTAGPSELTIRPKDPNNVPAGGLSSTVLRQVDFRSGAATLRELAGVTDAYVAVIKEQYKDGPKPIDFVREALAEGITDEYLAFLGSEYLGRVSIGEEKPVEKLAQELGKSPGTIKGHLWQARKRGLIVGGSPGRKGGEMSEKARQLAVNWYQKRKKAAGNRT